MKRLLIRSLVYVGVTAVVLILAVVSYEYFQLSRDGIVVLLYHRISENDGSKYELSPNKFAQQMKYLKDRGYKTVLPSEIITKHIASNPRKTVILTFDDGTEDHFTRVYPVLKANSFKGVFFIVTKYIGCPGNLTREQIKEMARNGMEIGSHSVSHPYFDEIDDNSIHYQLKRSRDTLKDIIGHPPVSFAPPGGWFDERCLKIAKDMGYKAVFGCEIGVNDLRGTPFVYKRIEVVAETSLEDFDRILHSPNTYILKNKLEQLIKFTIRGLVGSNNYRRLGKALQ